MGGLGSGRYDYATTPTVGRCHSVDVTKLTEVVADSEAVAHPEAVARYPWYDEYGHGEQVAEIGIRVERDGSPHFTATLEGVTREDVADDLAERATHLRLTYTVSSDSEDATEYDYPVRLEYTPCTFGGVRPWFRCPGRGCGDRVGKLYRPPGREVFACRECYELGYLSSRTSGDEVARAEQRYRDAYAKVDPKDRRPHPNDWDVPHIPDRPKGMHRDTYEELVDELEAARQEWDDAFMKELLSLRDGLKATREHLGI